MLRLKLAIAFFFLALFSALVTFSQAAPLADLASTRMLFILCVSCFVTGVTSSLYDSDSHAPIWTLRDLSLRAKHCAELGRSTT